MSMNEHLNDKYHREKPRMFLMIEIKIVLFWKEREDCYLDGEHQTSGARLTVSDGRMFDEVVQQRWHE